MPPWRRRRREPDKRLDWRDPNMPVLHEYALYDQYGGVVKRVAELVRPEVAQAESRVNLKLSDEPSWKRDPSYRWAEIKSIKWEEPGDE